jgi:two-component sensor histidine kinase
LTEGTSSRFVEGGGAMGAAIRAHDWAATALGPIETWPAPLKTIVGVMLASKFPMCIVWGDELVTLHNDAFTPILGHKPAALGRSFRAVWSEAWHVIGPIAARAYAGDATFIEDFPLQIERRGFPEQAYFTFCYSPILDEDGRVAGFLDTVVETTGKVAAERTARIHNAELGHRLQNTLALISAMAHQTLRSGQSASQMQEALTQRITALGRAHSILTQSSWHGAPLRTVIDGALEPHRTGRERVSLEGPPIELSARHALALALAINELATNATKYGALSVDTGSITICWEADEQAQEQRFRLTWTEQDGPAVTRPAHLGFGSRLIEEVLAAEFRGDVRITYDVTGVRCELDTHMRHLRIDP